VIYGSWSPDGSEFSFSSKGPKQMLAVYKKDTLIEQYTQNVEITPKWIYQAPQTSQKEVKGRKSYDMFNASIHKDNLEILAVYCTREGCELFLISQSGDTIKRGPISPIGDPKNDMQCVSEINNDRIAIGVQHGIFGFYHIDTLDLLTVIQATGSPRICMWDGDLFVTTAYVSGIVSFWSQDGQLLKEIKGGPIGSIVQMNRVEQFTYYICGIMSLHKVSFDYENSCIASKDDISYLTLTGCGLDISNTGLVTSGDFTGNIYLWQTPSRKPVCSFNVTYSIRCLLWVGDFLLIGCLNSEVSCWKYNSKITPEKEVSSVRNLYTVIGDPVALATNSDETKLALGTTAGYLYVFDLKKNEESLDIEVFHYSQIHKPKVNNDGSFLNMEIWNLRWSIDDRYIATTSEDQTAIVSDSLTGEVLKTLTGHTTAVTDISWKLLASGKHILATCADDRTIRIYDGLTFELITVLKTELVYGWYTLTYMEINEKNDRLFVTTQNGYLLSWDLNSFELIFCEKLHAGSIEGIALSKDGQSLVTLGSDCVVNMLETL